MQRAQSMSRLILGGALLVAAGCDRQVHLGDIGDAAASLLWSATFEVGNVSEWVGDGHGGAYVENAPGDPAATPAVSHRGRYAGVATFTTPTIGVASINYLFRNQPRVPAAYYSAWFYVPATFTVRSWLSLLHFRCSTSG